MGDRIESLRLVPAGGGRFEVTVNGQAIYSKLEVGRFPELTEIQQKIRLLLT